MEKTFTLEQLLSRISILEEEKKQIEEEKKQLEERLYKKIELNPEIKTLLLGIPELAFKKIVSDASNHTSSHDIVKVLHDGEFTILDNIESFYCDEEELISASTLLSRNDIKNRSIEYENETCIQDLVRDLFRDILLLSKLQGKVTILQESSVPDNSDDSKRNKPDIWILRAHNKAPILVIEVKSPSDTVLNNDKVTGQIFNYMASLRSFYGQQNVFGITTTFKEWKFHWFADTNECAKSPTVTTTFNDESSDLTTREIYSTKTAISHSDHKLIQILVSIIVKSYNSNVSPLFLSKSRTYIYITKSSWIWKKMDQNQLYIIDTSINIDMKKSEASFYVLKYFHSGDYSRVSLAISSKSSSLVVIKESKHVDQELFMWKTINGSNSAVIKLLNDKKVLIMPMVFHAFITDNKKVCFLFDIKQWSYEYNNAVDEDFPSKLAEIQGQIKMLAEEKTLTNVLRVADMAIKKCANAGYIHKDIEWRHIALMPVFDEDSKITDLSPILIDYEMSEKEDDTDKAFETMKNRLDEIAKGCTFE